MCLKTDLRSRPDSLIIRDTGPPRARGGGRAASRDTRAAGSGGLQCYDNLIRFTLQCNVARLTALLHRREDLDVGQVEEGRTLEVRARRLVEHMGRARLYVENICGECRREASAKSPSSRPRQRQIELRAASTPRPASASLGQMAEVCLCWPALPALLCTWVDTSSGSWWPRMPCSDAQLSPARGEARQMEWGG